jgi:hypothetical protein
LHRWLELALYDPVHPLLATFQTHEKTLYGRCATGLLAGSRIDCL